MGNTDWYHKNAWIGRNRPDGERAAMRTGELMFLGLGTTTHAADLVAVGLERANAVALIDLSDPTAPLVVNIAPVGIGPEGIKFFRVGSGLFVASANEVSGTVSILDVVF